MRKGLSNMFPGTRFCGEVKIRIACDRGRVRENLLSRRLKALHGFPCDFGYCFVRR